MGTPLGLKYIPYTYMDPLGMLWEPEGLEPCRSFFAEEQALDGRVAVE